MGNSQNNQNSQLKKILVSEEEIEGILTRISNALNEDYRDKKLLVCGILKGAFIFAADLIRRIDSVQELEVAFIKASSYGQSSASSGNVKVEEFSDLSGYKDKGFSLLIVDDILDSGYTLSFLEEYFKPKGFSDINFCVLLDKPERREKPVKVKYVGREIANEFVVGYGLDYNEKYRHLPYIAVYAT